MSAIVSSTGLGSLSSFGQTDTFQSGMSLLNSGISAYSQYQSSSIRSTFLKLQAKQHDLQANQYKIQGEQQSNVLRDQLLSNLSSVNALFSASGVDVGSRSARMLAAHNISTTRKDIQAIESGAELKTVGSIGTAGVKRAAATGVRAMGISSAAQQLFGETSQRAVSSLLRGF